MRFDLAEEIRERRAEIATVVTAEFLARHPDWLERYGERATVRGEEDASYHIDFLAASVETEQPEGFVDYVLWCAGVLERRGIARSFLSENLIQVGAAATDGISDEAAASVARAIAAGTAALEAPPSADADAAADRFVVPRRLYIDAATQGQRKSALGIVRELLSQGHTVLELYEYVFQEGLYEVGRLWAADRITVAEEHMATATTQYILGVLYDEVPPAQVTRGAAVITGVEGELHQVGANIVADALDADGWDVRFLGTNMPHASIIDVIEAHQPTLLGISASIITTAPRVHDLIAEVREHFNETNPVIFVGGGAFRAASGLWHEVGADTFAADVGEAVAAARKMAT